MQDTQERAVNGRVLGRQAKERRAELLAAVEKHVTEEKWRETSIIGVASIVGCSPATFYQYWGGDHPFEEAVAEIVRKKMASKAAMGKHWSAVKAILKSEGWDL